MTEGGNNTFEELVVFQNAQSAADFMAQAQQTVKGCVANVVPGSFVGTQPITRGWTAGLVYVAGGTSDTLGATYNLLARKGSAVFLAGGTGPWVPSNTPQPAAMDYYLPALN